MNFKQLKKDFLKKLSEELPDNLEYHNTDHTLSVLNSAERIAYSEKLSEEEMTILKTAALLHDCGFTTRYMKNEPEGCCISKVVLPDYDYTKEEIQTICKMIMATAIPQNPQNKLEEILCDADLDYLGGDIESFFKTANNLRLELENHGKSYSEEEWLNFELNFLKQHKYFTATQQKEKEPQKQRTIKKLEELLAQTRKEE